MTMPAISPPESEELELEEDGSVSDEPAVEAGTDEAVDEVAGSSSSSGAAKSSEETLKQGTWTVN